MSSIHYDVGADYEGYSESLPVNYKDYEADSVDSDKAVALLIRNIPVSYLHMYRVYVYDVSSVDAYGLHDLVDIQQAGEWLDDYCMLNEADWCDVG